MNKNIDEFSTILEVRFKLQFENTRLLLKSLSRILQEVFVSLSILTITKVIIDYGNRKDKK